MTKYAKGTEVSVEKTRAEIERDLQRFGCDAFTSGYEGRRAFILFRAKNRWIRLTLTLPDPSDPAFTLVRTNATTVARRSDASKAAALDAESRRIWRSLALLVKAKLAAVEDGIVEFEQEFLPHIVMADKRTVWERTQEHIALEYEHGEPRPLLPPPSGRTAP